MTNRMQNKNSISDLKNFIKFICIISVYFLLCLIPTPTGLSFAGQKALSMFVTIILLWAFEPVPMPIISFIFVPLVVFTGMMPLTSVLNNFATTSIFLIVAALMMSPAMEKTGLAERTVYFILSKIGCSSSRMLIGLL